MWRKIVEKYGRSSVISGLGGRGENLAAHYLQKKGYKIIERNWYNKKGKRLGEIDLVAQHGEQITFVEVKTRSSNNKEVLPEESITPAKLHKLNKIANAYIAEKELYSAPWQIDAVTIVYGEGKPQIKHLESIFI